MSTALLFLFGGTGVTLRYFLQAWMPSESFPTSTLAINLIGSFAIGILSSLLQQNSPLLSASTYLYLTTGLLGGFTTFSAYSLQSLELIQQGNFAKGFLYFVGSPILGLVSAFLGIFLVGFFK